MVLKPPQKQHPLFFCQGKYGLISGCLIWMGDEWYGYGVGLSMKSNIDGGEDIAYFF